jgi:hypothetical protein
MAYRPDQRIVAAADLVVKIIDRYAAEHRDLLLSQPECLAALRRLLETFVRSGWDQAIDRVAKPQRIPLLTEATGIIRLRA